MNKSIVFISLSITMIFMLGCSGENVEIPEGETLLSMSLKALDGSLQVGITKQDVEIFLDSNAIPYGFFERRGSGGVPPIPYVNQDDIGYYAFWIPLLQYQDGPFSPTRAVNARVILDKNDKVSNIDYVGMDTFL